MIATRCRQISLLLFSMFISFIGFLQMFERTWGGFPARYAGILAIVAALFLVEWGLLLKFQPYASQSILPAVLLLTSTGTIMIARIDKSNGTDVAFRQLVWVCVALIMVALITVFLQDYRLLRRFSYVSMVIGLLLLLSPMVPGLGKQIGGARIWIGIGGHTMQPGEFAKLFLAFFFAAYLFDHRDQLAVGGRRLMGIQLPRMRDLGPIIVVWIASMGVLVLQHDLGTSLMFFAMFVSMLYVATGRKSWLGIGFVAFVAGTFWPSGFSRMSDTVSRHGCIPLIPRSTAWASAVRGRSSRDCSGWPPAGFLERVWDRDIRRSRRWPTPTSYTRRSARSWDWSDCWLSSSCIWSSSPPVSSRP
ncbi:cell division protein [Bifidobacterium minimum]|uniref:Cell division protein n=1 Tax=Bifidobacterium minimum TaxID=1693 RepID=A0A087BSM2_9BIFI|nr:cell division protein [Bifidobacterium minimum]